MTFPDLRSKVYDKISFSFNYKNSHCYVLFYSNNRSQWNHLDLVGTSIRQAIIMRCLWMWQRSTLSRAGSAQGSRNAHFINRRQRETQQYDLIRFLQPHTYLTEITDITVRFETTHRRHRRHRSHRSNRSHITHKCHEKRLDLTRETSLRRTGTTATQSASI